jgi:hypothetical protein
MWWNVRPEQRTEFGDWHSHEHFPERMGIPGFRRGSRWGSTLDGQGFFVLYELEAYATLTSKAYLDRLNSPTPWSTKMMPHHLDMVRSQCRVAASFGGGIATALATIRLSPQAGAGERLKAALTELLRDYPNKPGLTGAHLLVTDTPRTASPTTEQRIRGADASADWIVLLSGYESEPVEQAASAKLSATELVRIGAQEKMIAGRYRLAYTMTPHDLATISASPDPSGSG